MKPQLNAESFQKKMRAVKTGIWVVLIETMRVTTQIMHKSRPRMKRCDQNQATQMQEMEQEQERKNHEEEQPKCKMIMMQLIEYFTAIYVKKSKTKIYSTSFRVFECILMIGSFTNHISIGSRNFHCCEVTWSYIRIHIGSSVSTVLQDSEPSAPIHHINGNTSITIAMFATGSLQAHSRSRCPI